MKNLIQAIMALLTMQSLQGQMLQVEFNDFESYSGKEVLIAKRQGGEKFYAVDTLAGFNTQVMLEPGLYSLVHSGRIIGDFVLFDSPISLSFRDTNLVYSDLYNQAFIRDNAKWMELIGNGERDSIPEIFKVAFPQMVRLDSGDMTTSKIHMKYWALPFSNWDFIVNSPFFNEMFEYYFEKLQFNSPDSIKKSVDLFMNKVPDKYRRQIEYKILNKYENHKVVGYENVFVHVGLTYLQYENALDTTDYKIIGKARSLSVNMVGNKANNFSIKNLEGEPFVLHNTSGILKVLFFFDPDCHHCQEAWPDFLAFCRDHSDVGLKGFAISLSENEEELREFLSTYGTTDNLLVAYPGIGSIDTFRGKYYIPSTPAIYVLTSANKVLARNLSVKDLEPFMRISGF